MRSLTDAQLAIINCPIKLEVSWLYQIDASGNGTIDYYWSTKEKTWDSQDYDFRVIQQDDIEMNRNMSETGRISPCSFGFTATNLNSTLRSEDFNGGTVTILLVIKADTTTYGIIEEEVARWSFDIEQAVLTKVQTLEFKCQDFLRKYLNGSYPNTKTIHDVLPSVGNEDASFCIPKVFGAPYIPLGTTATNATLWYVVGPNDSYTFYKARTPHEWPTDQLAYEWTSTTNGGDTVFASEATTGLDGNEYRLLTIRAMDTTGDQVPDSNVALKNGDSYYNIPVKFGRDAALATTNPVDIMHFIMRDFGVPVSHIDATTRTSSAASCTTWGLSMNFGLWYYREREELLSSLAVQSNMELVLRDKIYFKPHSSSSVATIDKSCVVRTVTKSGSSVDIRGAAKFEYTPNTLVPTISDSGKAVYQSSSFPIDSLKTYTVPVKDDADHISDTQIDCMYIGDALGLNAYKIAKLALQRILLPSGKVEMTLMPSMLKLECDDIVTITPQDYGAGTDHEYDILIDSIKLSKDLQVVVSGTRFSQPLDDFVGIANPTGQTPYVGTVTGSYSPVVQGSDQSGSGLNAINKYVWVGSHIFIDGDTEKISVHHHTFASEGVQFGMSDDHPRLYIGDGVAGGNYLQFRYNDGYKLSWDTDYTRLNEDGSFFSTRASIGGWHASTSTLSGRNLILDSTGSIYSRNYVGDHAGFKIFDNGSAEFLDLKARGSFHASVFVADEIMAISNTAILSNSSTLATVCTTAGAINGNFTITVNDPPIGAYQIFSANEFLVIKTLIGTNIEEIWGQVVDYDSSGFTNGYRDNGDGTGSYYVQLKDGSTNFAIPSGVAVVRYGASDEDNLLLTSDNDNGPYVEIFTVGSTPWNGTTVKSRFGNLSSINDDDFPTMSGYGLYADNVYLKGHIVISGGTGVQNFDDWEDAIGQATDGTVDWIEINGVPEDIFYKNSDNIGDVTWLTTYLSGKEVISPIIAGNLGFFSEYFSVGATPNGIIIDGTTATGACIKSASFASGSDGWKISNSGDAQFNNIQARGNIVLTGQSSGLENLGFTDSSSLSTNTLIYLNFDDSFEHSFGIDALSGSTATLASDGFVNNCAYIESETTNLIDNNHFESNITGWTNLNYETCARVASSNPITNTTGVMHLVNSSGQGYVAGTHITPANSPITITVYIDMSTDYSDAIGIGGLMAYTDTSYDDHSWDVDAISTNLYDNVYKLTKTITPNPAKTIDYYEPRIATGSSIDVSILAIQVEQLSYSTSFVDGTRSAAILKYRYDLTRKGTFHCKVKLRDDVTDLIKDAYIFDNETPRLVLFIQQSTNLLNLYVNSSSACTINISSWEKDVWHTIQTTWDFDAPKFRLIADGTLASSTTSATWSTESGVLVLGSRYSQEKALSGYMDEVRVDNIVRTTTELAQWRTSSEAFDINFMGSGPSSSVPSLHLTPDLIGMWRVDRWGTYIDANGNIVAQTSSGNYALRYFGIDMGGYGEGDLLIGDPNSSCIWWNQSIPSLSIINADLSLSGGRSLTVTGHDTTPGEVKWNGSSYTVRSYMSAIGDDFYISPLGSGDRNIDLWLGGSSSRYGEINLYARDYINLYSYYDSNSHARFILEGMYTPGGSPISFYSYWDCWDNGYGAYLRLMAASVGTEIVLTRGHIIVDPARDRIYDIGAAGVCHRYMYAHGFNTDADFYVFDEYDDLAVIDAIRPRLDKDNNPIRDPVSGHILIDDDTLPEWLLFKNPDNEKHECAQDGTTVISSKKKGEIARHDDGTPFVSLSAMDSLLMGAIKQLKLSTDKEISAIKEKLNKIEEDKS